MEVAGGLRELIAAERKYLGECLDGLKPNSLNPPQNRLLCWQYANDALLKQVLEAKEAVYQQMDDWLKRLSVRLNHLTAYVQEWARHIPDKLDAALLVRAPSVILPEEAVKALQEAMEASLKVDLAALDDGAGLMQALRDLVAQGLPDRDKQGKPTLFAAGPPLHLGAPDFSYLHSLEKAVFENIAHGPASPYTQEVLALLESQAVGKGVPLVNLIGGSELLINFQTGAVEYATLHFLGNPTHETTILHPDQKGFPAFKAAMAGHAIRLHGWPGDTKQVSVWEQVTDAINKHVVSYVRERCSVVTEFIVGYGLEERMHWEGLDHFPGLSDKRITIPPPRAAILRAEKLLLGALVLKQNFVFLGGEPPFNKLTYTVVDRDGFARRAEWHAPVDYTTATRLLAHQDKVMDAIHLQILHYRQDNRGAAAEEVKKACEEINEQALAKPAKLEGDLLWPLPVRNINFDRALSWLVQFAMDFDIPLPKVDHPYAQVYTRGEILPSGGMAPYDGWYCKKCGCAFGIIMPRRDGKCEACGHPF
jgi:hypothetical protein